MERGVPAGADAADGLCGRAEDADRNEKLFLDRCRAAVMHLPVKDSCRGKVSCIVGESFQEGYYLVLL